MEQNKNKKVEKNNKKIETDMFRSNGNGPGSLPTQS